MEDSLFEKIMRWLFISFVVLFILSIISYLGYLIIQNLATEKDNKYVEEMNEKNNGSDVFISYVTSKEIAVVNKDERSEDLNNVLNIEQSNEINETQQDKNVDYVLYLYGSDETSNPLPYASVYVDKDFYNNIKIGDFISYDFVEDEEIKVDNIRKHIKE